MSTTNPGPEETGAEGPLGADGNAPLREPESAEQGSQPRWDERDGDEALDEPADPREEDPTSVDVDPSRIGGDPAEDDM